jgi:hypothetical protein
MTQPAAEDPATEMTEESRGDSTEVADDQAVKNREVVKSEAEGSGEHSVPTQGAVASEFSDDSI